MDVRVSVDTDEGVDRCRCPGCTSTTHRVTGTTREDWLGDIIRTGACLARRDHNKQASAGFCAECARLWRCATCYNDVRYYSWRKQNRRDSNLEVCAQCHNLRLVMEESTVWHLEVTVPSSIPPYDERCMCIGVVCHVGYQGRDPCMFGTHDPDIFGKIFVHEPHQCENRYARTTDGRMLHPGQLCHECASRFKCPCGVACPADMENCPGCGRALAAYLHPRIALIRDGLWANWLDRTLEDIPPNHSELYGPGEKGQIARVLDGIAWSTQKRLVRLMKSMESDSEDEDLKKLQAAKSRFDSYTNDDFKPMLKSDNVALDRFKSDVETFASPAAVRRMRHVLISRYSRGDMLRYPAVLRDSVVMQYGSPLRYETSYGTLRAPGTGIGSLLFDPKVRYDALLGAPKVQEDGRNPMDLPALPRLAVDSPRCQCVGCPEPWCKVYYAATHCIYCQHLPSRCANRMSPFSSDRGLCKHCARRTKCERRTQYRSDDCKLPTPYARCGVVWRRDIQNCPGCGQTSWYSTHPSNHPWPSWGALGDRCECTNVNCPHPIRWGIETDGQCTGIMTEDLSNDFCVGGATLCSLCYQWWSGVRPEISEYALRRMGVTSMSDSEAKSHFGDFSQFHSD